MVTPPIASAPLPAIAAAQRGMSASANRVAEAAARVADFGTRPPESPNAAAAAPIIPGATATPIEAMVVAPDPTRAMADLRQAQRAYQANAAVLRTADEMAATALRRTA